MFQSLTERLSLAVRNLTGRGRISEDNVRDTVRKIRMALLEADVALPVAKGLVDRVRERALGAEVARSLDPGQAFVKIVHDELVAVLGGEEAGLKRSGRPSVIMLVGLQGAGKTTTAAKLAKRLTERSKERVLLVSTDVYRPAARAQLATLARDLGVECVEPGSAEPVAIAQAALAHARSGGHAWLIVDTAGRLHVDRQMMAEAAAIRAAVDPAETLFIVDAMAGQDAVNSARAFHESVPLTGAILTKADGDARGGVALSVREATGVPIKLVGTGEKLDALDDFVPKRMASRILGMGDMVGFVESVQRQADEQVAQKIATKIKRGRELDLVDLRSQLEQIQALGGIGSLLDKLPGVNPAALQASGFDERQIRRQIGIINSMTPRERRHPALIDGSRKRRIAAGAGLSLQDVNRLLKQHKLLAKTMKRVSKGGGMQQLLENVRRPRDGFPGGRR
ncbi:MAG TPA: signal recognition particle protein [Gammaproteobacteria bacterium]|jgi:signal recognition particle subunit SRP54